MYKYGFLVLVFALSLLSFSPLINAAEYGSNSYNQGPYSTYTPPSGTTGTTQAYRNNFLAQQQALIQQPVTTTTTTSSIPIITKTLKFKMTSNEVRELQVYLNTHGYPVATTGLGSTGKETNYFGPLTKKAVIKFQIANGLKGDGIVGPLTKSKLK